MERPTVEDWSAALLAVARHEFAPAWLEQHVSRPVEQWSCPQPAADCPEELRVGVCGAAVGGVYALCHGARGLSALAVCYRSVASETHLHFCPELGLWAISVCGEAGPTPSDVDCRTHYGLGRSGSGAPQLLYIGGPAATADPRKVEWVAVRGRDPAPAVSSEAEPLPIEAVGSAGGWSLPAEPAAVALSWALDLRCACGPPLRPGVSYFGDDGSPETAPEIARRVFRHAEDARQIAAVCGAWRRTVQAYRGGWAAALRSLLQLEGLRLEPVAPAPVLLRSLAQSSWRDMLSLTCQPGFSNHAWPILVSEVKLSMPCAKPDEGQEGYHALRKLCRPFAVLARRLLHDVPVPWVKKMKSRPKAQLGRTTNNEGADLQLTANLVLDLGLACLSRRAGLFISPGGFVTLSGGRLRDRLHPALQELREALPDLAPVAQTSSWVSSFGAGGEGDMGTPRAGEPSGGSWSSLSYVWGLRFRGAVGGRPTELDFRLGGEVFPFSSASRDDAVYKELAAFGAYGPGGSFGSDLAWAAAQQRAEEEEEEDEEEEDIPR